jgi:hypothetical protein
MIEFVLSRVWMVMAGLSVMVVVLAAFGGLDRSVERDADLAGASSLSAAVSDLQREGSTGELRVELNGVMSGEASYTIYRWGIEVRGAGHGDEFLDMVTLLDGAPVDRLEVGPSDVLVIRAWSGQVQVEKVSTT